MKDADWSVGESNRGLAEPKPKMLVDGAKNVPCVHGILVTNGGAWVQLFSMATSRPKAY